MMPMSAEDLLKIRSSAEPTIALLPWGDVWEDFFSSIGVDFESFCNELTGGWQFGFIEALKVVGIRTVMIYTSMNVDKPSSFLHQPTGSVIHVLPVPSSYRAIRRRMVHSYPSMGYWGTLEDLFGNVHGSSRQLFKLLRHVAPYLTISIWQLAKILRQEGCRAIFCQEYEYSRFDICVLLGKLLGIPTFASFQGGNSDYNRIGHFLRPLTMKLCEGLAIGCQIEIKRVLDQYHLPPSRISRIFNPVDLKMWKPIDTAQARAIFGVPSNAEVVIWHGRVNLKEKGLDILLEAWQNVCKQRPERDFRLLLMGSAEHTEDLRDLIAGMSLKNILWIDKYVNDRNYMRDFLCTGDVFAFPSRYEGFPVSPLEAMACGLPVVAAEASGVPDIFENGEKSGGLVVPLDDPESFAEGLGRLLDNHSLRKEMGKCARGRIESAFSIQTIGTQLAQLFHFDHNNSKSKRYPPI